MKDKHIISLFFIVLLILTSCIFIKPILYPTIENLEDRFGPPKNIILVGDILFNDNFKNLMRDVIQYEKKTKRILNIEVVSSKCAENLNYFEKELNRLAKNKNFNNKNTWMFISIGTNDIINNLYNCKGSSRFILDNGEEDKDKEFLKDIMRPVNTLEIEKELPHCKNKETITENWKEKMNYLIKKFPSVNKIIINFYNIPHKEYSHCNYPQHGAMKIKQKALFNINNKKNNIKFYEKENIFSINDQYSNFIEKINTDIINYSKSKNLLMISAYDILNRNDFNYDQEKSIELNRNGMMKIIEKIIHHTVGINSQSNS